MSQGASLMPLRGPRVMWQEDSRSKIRVQTDGRKQLQAQSEFMYPGFSHLNQTYLTQVFAQVARVCLEITIYLLSLCSSSAEFLPSWVGLFQLPVVMLTLLLFQTPVLSSLDRFLKDELRSLSNCPGPCHSTARIFEGLFVCLPAVVWALSPHTFVI